MGIGGTGGEGFMEEVISGTWPGRRAGTGSTDWSESSQGTEPSGRTVGKSFEGLQWGQKCSGECGQGVEGFFFFF